MIHKVLKAYFAKKKSQKVTADIVLAIVITAIFGVSTITLLIWKFNPIIKLIIQIAIIVLYFVYVVCSENKRCKRWEIDFTEYNNTLDEISKILKKLKYQKGSGEGNWYSKEKIDYLIVSAEKWITEQNEGKAKLEKLAHIIVLPVVGFVAAVIQENASIADAISIGVVVIIALAMVYVIDRILSIVVDAVIKTASIDKMAMLMNLLQDLRARDFT